MLDSPNVHVRVEERIAWLTIDHPKVNALSVAVLDQLDAALDEAMADEAVKVVIITGAGQAAFAGGADIKELAAFAASGDRDGARDFLRKGQALFDKIEACPKPVIAAVNGVALGGGLELALACHIRILSQSARLGRQPAAGAPGRRKQGAGVDPDRGPRGRRRGAAERASQPGRST
jgi:enoyl-CoA hydratase/carnithine racemase